MLSTPRFRLSRRAFTRLGLALAAPLALMTAAGRLVSFTAEARQPTPACTDADDPTPAQTEGPYFKSQTPERSSLLEAGLPGTRLVVAGQVLTRRCEAVPQAKLEFWQADANGQYDNVGYRLRGHQFTDAEGRYQLETIVPGVYPGRTRHIHVMVQAPSGPVLTTQLYFPDEPRNRTDGLFNPRLLLPIETTGDAQQATFDFVLSS